MTIDILDKSQDYGIVSPIWLGASYEQNQKLYDAHGNRVYRPGEERPAADEAETSEDPTPLATEPAPAPQAAPVKGKPQAKAAAPVAVAKPVNGEAPVNLAAWQAGKAKYRFALVRDAIRDRYKIEVMDEKQAFAALGSVGLISEAEAETKAAAVKPLREGRIGLDQAMGAARQRAFGRDPQRIAGVFVRAAAGA